MAAPDLRLRTPNGTGANSSTQSANGSRASRRGKTKSFLRRKDEGEPEVPPVGRQRSLWTRSRKKDVDTGWPSHGRLRTPNGTGANSSTQSANGSRASRRGKTKSFLRRKDEGETEVPPAGRQRSLWTRSRKKDVDTGWPSHGSRNRQRAVLFLTEFACE